MKSQRLMAVDMVRALTILGVIMVHATWFTSEGRTLTSAYVLTLLHFTREVFMAITGLVLTQAMLNRPTSWQKFFRKRYPVIGIPYILWSLIYVVRTLGWQHPWLIVTTTLADLPTGRAAFDLYYLLITIQFYTIFPVFFWLIRLYHNKPWRLWTAVFIFEVLLMAYDAFGLGPHPQGINHYTGLEVWTYSLYFVSGGLLATSWERASQYLRQHRLLIAGGWGLSWMILTGVFLWTAQHKNLMTAQSVLQPAMVPYSIMTFILLLMAGQMITEAVKWGWIAGLLRQFSTFSLGIYLIHPMILEPLASWATTQMPWAIADLFSVIVTASVSLGIIRMISRTRLGLWLTGRSTAPSPKRAPVPALP
ncbi:acyltransferase [Sulfobacillus thermosulfidooxidans]|uniref:acyltransferase n=1 Tax=Sulfobacillus thermosulfidooxidans TaxID=28034 RepID=UPI0006B53DFF|nr:acyltransferase [Sulfobacillus thermosulfidooxidans]